MYSKFNFSHWFFLTASKELSFYLVPHNYFPEDPSMASRDAHLEYDYDYDY